MDEIAVLWFLLALVVSSAVLAAYLVDVEPMPTDMEEEDERLRVAARWRGGARC